MPDLSQKQKEYLRNSNKRWNMKVGAVRSGKTFVDIYHIIPYYLRKYRNLPGLNVFIGVSRDTIERNILQPMREQFTDSIVGFINSRNIAMVCGVPVYCLGAEKSSQIAKIQGSSIKYCYGDEMAKWNQGVFAMLQSRLDKPYSRFDGACNPEYPSHWLKEFIDNPSVDSYIQTYTIFDNPFLGENFIENLCKEYQGTVYYKRYILGEWTMAEGLIYPMYEDALAEMPDKQIADICLSIDYGTQNAFACIFWAKVDGVWYAIDEYYYSGRSEGIQKTDEEYLQDIIQFTAKTTERLSARMNRLADDDGKLYQKVQVIIDPTAASFIASLRKSGIFKVIPADNDVLDGIRETASAMHNGMIKISPRLKNWQKEISGYVWNDNSIEDAPVKEDDHLMDAMRYFVKTKKITKKTDRYTPFIYK